MRGNVTFHCEQSTITLECQLAAWCRGEGMVRWRDEWADEWRATGAALFHCVFFKEVAFFLFFFMIILIPPRTSQPEPSALSPPRSHSLIKTQSQATNSNKPSASSLKKKTVRAVKMQITVGLSAIPSVYDIGNRNAPSNHY